MSGTLEGRTVLITGAAQSRAWSRTRGGKAGAHVIVTSLSENGRGTTEEIVAAGGAATWVQCDVTDRAAVRHAVAEAVRIAGRLDGLVHNAFARPNFDDPGGA